MKKIILTCGYIFALSIASADLLVDWDFSNVDYSAAADNTPAANPVQTAPFARAAAGLTASDLTQFGLLTTTGNPVAGEVNLKNWDVGGNGSNEGFLEFTLTAVEPGGLSVDQISISLWRNGTGAPNGIAFDVSINGGGYAPYAAVQTDPNAGDFGFDTFTFSASIPSVNSLGVRFTPRAAGQGSTGNIHINGWSVHGTAVPEPSVFGLLLLGVALLRFRQLG